MSLERRVSSLIVVLIISLVVWVAFMVLTEVSPDYPDVVSMVRSRGSFPWQHYVMYANAAALTVLTAAVFAGFTAIYAEDFPLTSRIAGFFIPAYAFGNLFVYLSQIVILPRLGNQVPGDLALQLVQTSDGTVMQFVNAMSYALLGISSLLFGRVLVRDPVGSSVGGTLLTLSGILSWLAVAGVAAGNEILMLLSFVSGGVFLIAMVIIASRLSKG